MTLRCIHCDVTIPEDCTLLLSEERLGKQHRDFVLHLQAAHSDIFQSASILTAQMSWLTVTIHCEAQGDGGDLKKKREMVCRELLRLLSPVVSDNDLLIALHQFEKDWKQDVYSAIPGMYTRQNVWKLLIQLRDRMTYQHLRDAE